MTDLLYLPDNEYQKEFEAEVTKTREQDSYICLDQTLFYKEGGGQPADHGRIVWDGGEAEVVDVQKEHGEVRHFLEGNIPDADTEVRGEVDWDRRYKHMRMHTAQHVVSYVVLQMFDASTAGNQVHEDQSRIDFKPVEFDEEDIQKIEKAANSIIEKDYDLRKRMRDRELVEEEVQEGRTNLDLIPSSVDPLRVVEIGDIDMCPCGGTHVDSTGEIGGINIVNRVSKGSNVERLEFELEE
jgi:misacylated tRNA(Ala) deacylase